MITEKMLENHVNESYNYWELLQFNIKYPGSFPDNHFPKVLLPKTDREQKFFERSTLVRSDHGVVELLFILVDDNGKLLDDSYGKYIEVPTYPCNIACIELPRNAAPVFEEASLIYFTDYKKCYLETVTAEVNGAITLAFAIQPPYNLESGITNTILEMIKSKDFIKSLS